MNKNFTITLSITAAMIGLSLSANAQATGTVVTNAEVITPISIAGDVALEFGSIVGTTAGGTVTIATDGTRTGTTELIPSNVGTAPAAAQFTVTGQEDYTYSLTLPTVAFAITNGATGTMDVDGFTSNETGNLTGGTEVINVGATLTVGVNQESGTYTSAIGEELSVTVQYN